MTDNDVVSSEVLSGWAPEEFSAAGVTHQLFVRGSGPGVVLLPEVPGLTPAVMTLADHLVDSGFTVAVVSLFGTPGRPPSAGYAAASFAKACVSREFLAFARHADRPVAEYVRAVARELHRRAGGPGVGVIGMCFSGGFALAAAADPAVLAPVASQPSVPLPIGSRKRDIGMSDRERAAVSERVQHEGLCLVGLRFSEDSASPGERFRALRAAFGDGWHPIQLNSRPGNEAGIGKNEHAVLTSKDAGTPGHPTHAARAEVVDFLRERLAVSAQRTR